MLYESGCTHGFSSFVILVGCWVAKDEHCHLPETVIVTTVAVGKASAYLESLGHDLVIYYSKHTTANALNVREAPRAADLTKAIKSKSSQVSRPATVLLARSVQTLAQAEQ